MLGQEQYALFVQERFEERQKTISDPLKKNKLSLFSQKKNLTKADHQVTALKEDRYLFRRLYISSQNRDRDLQNFFKHENQPYPPLTVWWAALRHQVWLLQCLAELSTPVDTVFMPYIRRKFTAVHRVDIVWDVHKSSSLKSGTHTKRLRRRVTLSTANQEIGKASCEWMRTRQLFLCLQSRLLWCMWMERRWTAHKAQGFSVLLFEQT